MSQKLLFQSLRDQESGAYAKVFYKKDFRAVGKYLVKFYNSLSEDIGDFITDDREFAMSTAMVDIPLHIRGV